MKSDVYRPAPARVSLSSGEVHIWRAWIARRNDLDDLAASLAEDERRRAVRFHFDADRQRFIAARGVLRRLIGHYLQMPPAEVAFQYGPQGKPQLRDAAPPRLCFNLAHSGDLALYAFARDCRLGVDIEWSREVLEAMSIARKYFTPAESEHLQATGANRMAAFFRLWTRKEAVIKAVGTGIATPLWEFDVSGTASDSASWQRVQVPSQPRPEWLVCDLPAAEGYCSAIAVERPADATEAVDGPTPQLHFFRDDG